MTPFSKLVKGKHGISLDEANDIIWDNKINTLPIVDENQRMRYFVFRKDYENHMNNPYELLTAIKDYWRRWCQLLGISGNVSQNLSMRRLM